MNQTLAHRIGIAAFLDKAPVAVVVVDWTETVALFTELGLWETPDLSASLAADPEARSRIVGSLRLEYANQATLDVFGVPDGATLARLLPGLLAASEAPEHVLGAFRRQQQRLDIEVTFRPPDGRLKRVRLVWIHAPSRAEPYAVTAALDVTERWEAAKALQASEARYLGILQSQTDFVVRYRPDGVRTFVNQAYADFFGGRPDDHIGTSFFDLIAPDHQPAVREKLRRLASGAADVLEDEHLSLRADGAARWTWWVDRVIRDADGQLLELQAVGRDITDRRAAEAERRRLQAQLFHAQKMDAIGKLAGGIAHDFNNVLSGIYGCAHLIATADDAEASSAVRELARSIDAAVDRAAELTHDLLTLSRPEDGQVEACDLGDVVMEAYKLLRRTLPSSISIDLALADVPTLYADGSQLFRAILNLGINARDAMSGEGHMTIRTTVEPNDGRDCVVIAVVDDGVGIAFEELGRIFEPFHTTKADGSGTGLGLAMVYACAQAHGGIAGVDSVVGEGSTFWIRFPMSIAAEEPHTSPPSEVLRGSETVLLVDDDEFALISARGVLERAGYHVVTAGNGSEALGLLEARPATFDVIATDLVMSEMGGRELLRRVRELVPELPVVVLTGGDPRDVSDAGFDAVLAKPFTPGQLTASLRQILDR